VHWFDEAIFMLYRTMVNIFLWYCCAKRHFFWPSKEKPKKNPAAPASFNVSAITSGVVAEPDDAGLDG